MRFIVAFAFLACFAALGYIGYQSISESAPIEPTPTPATEPAPAPAPPLLVPIDDAQDVVDQINDNTVEDELIEELGIPQGTGG